MKTSLLSAQDGLMILIVLAYVICFAAIKVGLVYAPPLLFAGLRALIWGLAIAASASTAVGSIMMKRLKKDGLPQKPGL